MDQNVDTLYSATDIWSYLYLEKNRPSQNTARPEKLKYTYDYLMDSIELISVQSGRKHRIWPLSETLSWDSIQFEINPRNRTKYKDQLSFISGESADMDAIVQLLFLMDGIKYLTESSHADNNHVLLFSGADTLYNLHLEMLPFYLNKLLFEPGGKARLDD